jgi:hypothetical protein
MSDARRGSEAMSQGRAERVGSSIRYDLHPHLLISPHLSPHVLISPHLILTSSPHLTSPHLTFFHFFSPFTLRLFSPHLIPPLLTSPHLTRLTSHLTSAV